MSTSIVRVKPSAGKDQHTLPYLVSFELVEDTVTVDLVAHPPPLLPFLTYCIAGLDERRDRYPHTIKVSTTSGVAVLVTITYTGAGAMHM